jgi:hypothetical protein
MRARYDIYTDIYGGGRIGVKWESVWTPMVVEAP